MTERELKRLPIYLWTLLGSTLFVSAAWHHCLTSRLLRRGWNTSGVMEAVTAAATEAGVVLASLIIPALFLSKYLRRFDRTSQTEEDQQEATYRCTMPMVAIVGMLMLWISWEFQI